MSSAALNSKIECYLSPEAIRFLNDVESKGLDRDLAFAVLVQLAPEEYIYTLDETDKEVVL